MNRVMLADDEPIVRKALQTLPDWAGMECQVVYTAKNGIEVLEHLEEMKPDILVTDIKMPGVDGIELAKYVWEKKLPIRVIILTAYADFSYAQSAVRYGVAEYVTKTGSLSGLEEAVNRCREDIAARKLQESGLSRSTAVENFFRAVFDGGLYEREDILKKARELDLSLARYRVALFHVRILPGEEREEAAREREINRKTAGFLREALEDKLIWELFLKKDRLCMVLREFPENGRDALSGQCRQSALMLEGFLPASIRVGISGTAVGAESLKEACDQAESALSAYFLDGQRVVTFFGEDEPGPRELPQDGEERVSEICRAVQRGDGERAAELFGELLKEQRQRGLTAAAIKSTGMDIQGRCRKMIADSDDAFPRQRAHTGGIAHMIYGCMYADEYRKIMEELIRNTARAAGLTHGRRDDIVAACSRYIEEHYTEAVSVTQIADAIGTNVSYLSRVFRETTGGTVIGTINGKKLEKAKEYLEQTDLKVYEIADMLGFENVNYFSHFFKKQTGTAPTDWAGNAQSKSGTGAEQCPWNEEDEKKQ